MAQNRKASEEEVRKSLREAVAKARKELTEATEEYTNDGSLGNLRKVQVATDRLAKLNAELHGFDSARSVESLRQSDANPRRQKKSWPVGKPYDPQPRPKPASSRPPVPPKEKPPLPPPVTSRPPVLADRREGKERVSWWVGADRATVAAGSRALQTLPPSKTAVVPSKQTIRKETQKQNEAKRERREELSRKLQDQLKPTAGAFSVIPKAE